jgi:hypothetical protein
MPRIVTWNSEEEVKKQLGSALKNATDARKYNERQWELSERTLQNTTGFLDKSEDYSLSFDSEAELEASSEDKSIGINYTSKNVRLIHSQLSANPPTVIARPTSNDSSDRRKADTADRLIRYAIRQYKMQERFDECTLNVLYYGTGFIKVLNDPNAGDLLEFDEESGEIQMEGDIVVKVPSPWNIFIDPDADSWDEVKYVIERMYVPWEEAMSQFPDKKEILKKAKLEELREGQGGADPSGSDSAIYSRKYDVVELYQYWEKGLPHNGMQGRFCWMLKDGTPLSKVEFNPHRFSRPVDEEGETEGPSTAQLPYHIMTDLDIPNTVLGKATVDYAVPMQDTHNRMMNVMLDNLRAHGVARIVLPEGAEIADDVISNNPLDIIKFTGGNGQQPNYMEPMPFPASFGQMMEMIKGGIDDSAGVNEAMFGQMQRETSGFSLQYATNQGNMIRRRLFNKYVLLTESVYKTFLQLVRKHWKTPKRIKVLGTEKAFNVVEISGMDIAGGFDLVVEYGASLSLDPTTRREEILTLLPLFEKAGVSTRTILSMLKLNELDAMYDEIQLANDRQYEYFKEMIETGEYLEPRKLEDHKNMLEFSYRYVMTSEFKYLDDDSKELIYAHIEKREQLAATPAQPTEASALAGAPAPGGAPDLGALLGGLA